MRNIRQVNFKVLPHGLYILLPMPQEPWVDMDFMLSLPRSKGGRDFIFVVKDKFFLRSQISYLVIKLMMQLT